MRIHFRVCADFYDKYGKEIYRVRPADLEGYHDVPEEIRQDPLFQMLEKDGSIVYADKAEKQRAIENDPMAGATADGKEVKPKTSKTKSTAKSKTKEEKPSGAEAEAKETAETAGAAEAADQAEKFLI